MSQQEVDKQEIAKRFQKAGKLMQMVETGKYKSGNIDPTALEGGDQLTEQPPSMGPQMDSTPTPDSFDEPSAGGGDVGGAPSGVGDLSQLDKETRKEKVENSNLPGPVKEALIENPTPKPSMNSVNNSVPVEEIKKLMGGGPTEGGDDQMIQEQSPQGNDDWVKEQKPNNGGSEWVEEEVPQNKQTINEDPSPEQLINDSGPASAPAPNTGSGNNSQMLTEERTRNIIKEEFINLMFNDNIKNSLVKEVKEEAVKEALRDIKNKLKKSKKRTNNSSR